MPKIITLVKVV